MTKWEFIDKLENSKAMKDFTKLTKTKMRDVKGHERYNSDDGSTSLRVESISFKPLDDRGDASRYFNVNFINRYREIGFHRMGIEVRVLTKSHELLKKIRTYTLKHSKEVVFDENN